MGGVLPYKLEVYCRTFKELQARPNSHLPAREAPEDQNKHVQIRAPTPSSVKPAQVRTPSWKTPQRGTYSQRGVQIRVGLELSDTFSEAGRGWGFRNIAQKSLC